MDRARGPGARFEDVESRGGDEALDDEGGEDEEAPADDDAAPVVDKVAPAKPWVEVVTFEPVPPGTYAVKMFQDYNRNQKFDFNWMGIPAERYGFSNNAGPDWMHLAPPSFDAARIVLRPGANAISIWLH